MPSWFNWAISMLGLIFVEFIALSHILFYDRHRDSWGSGYAVKLYFVIVTASLILQLLGAIIGAIGWYRLGGVIQIVSSSIHVPKGEGIIGIVGGLKCYRYPDELAQKTEVEGAS